MLRSSSSIDRIAMCVATACGLHCICFPVLLAISTASSFVHMLSEPMEVGFILLAFVLGLTNLSFSWWRSHHRPECLLLFAMGMMLMLVRDHIAGTAMSTTASVCGGVLVGAAHLRNIRLVRKCGCAARQYSFAKDPRKPALTTRPLKAHHCGCRGGGARP
jgi:hypothetical protein